MPKKMAADHNEVPRPCMLAVTEDRARSLITAQIQKGEALQKREVKNYNDTESLAEHFSAWDRTNEDILSRIFDGTKYAEDYKHSVAIYFEGHEWQDDVQRYRTWTNGYLAYLRSLLENVLPMMAALNTVPSIASSNRGAVSPSEKTGHVFIVHGHNHLQREEVRVVLLRLELQPIVLDEEAAAGQTLIEKLENHAHRAEYAIVLFTADDLGQAKDADRLTPRPRQNVLYELGFFHGKLGRPRVCLLLEKGVDPPSDLEGLVYISLNEKDWSLKLAKELKQAGLNIDLNKLF